MGKICFTEETTEPSVEVKVEEKENGEDKKDDLEKPPYTRPLRCDVGVSVMEIEWDTEITDHNLKTVVEKDISTFKAPNMRISKT